MFMTSNGRTESAYMYKQKEREEGQKTMAMDEKFRRQLEESGADVEATLKRFMGKDSIYLKFLGKFPNDPNYANLGTNMESGNFEEAYKCAHALKGVVGNLGLTPIFETVSTLVEELRNKANADVDAARANEEWQAVRKVYEQFIGIINENIPQ